MIRTTDLFKIDGKPMLPPDEDVAMSFADLDASDSGRDEGGYMHRIVARRMMGTWGFVYHHLTNEQYAYLESLFAGKTDFVFTHPSRTDCTVPVETRAYRSKYGIVWHSARTKDYRDLKFNIIEC